MKVIHSTEFGADTLLATEAKPTIGESVLWAGVMEYLTLREKHWRDIAVMEAKKLGLDASVATTTCLMLSEESIALRVFIGTAMDQTIKDRIEKQNEMTRKAEEENAAETPSTPEKPVGRSRVPVSPVALSSCRGPRNHHPQRGGEES